MVQSGEPGLANTEIRGIHEEAETFHALIRAGWMAAGSFWAAPAPGQDPAAAPPPESCLRGRRPSGGRDSPRYALQGAITGNSSDKGQARARIRPVTGLRRRETSFDLKNGRRGWRTRGLRSGRKSNDQTIYSERAGRARRLGKVQGAVVGATRPIGGRAESMAERGPRSRRPLRAVMLWYEPRRGGGGFFFLKVLSLSRKGEGALRGGRSTGDDPPGLSARTGCGLDAESRAGWLIGLAHPEGGEQVASWGVAPGRGRGAAVGDVSPGCARPPRRPELEAVIGA